MVVRLSYLVKRSRLFYGLRKVGNTASTSKQDDGGKKPEKKDTGCERSCAKEDPRDKCTDECNKAECLAVATAAMKSEGAKPDAAKPAAEKPSEVPEVALMPKEEEEEDGSEAKVIIVGAGLSGLSAANRLTTMGVNNITVLEATNRAGGRIVSSWFGDTVVNLGGVWDEDGSCESSADYLDNPVLHHADRLGMIRSNKVHLARNMVTECDGSTLPLPASFLAVTKMKRILAVGESLRSTSSYADLGKTDSYIGMRMHQELRSIPEEMKATSARVFAALAVLALDKTYIDGDTFGPYVHIPGSGVKIPLGCTGVLSPLLKNSAKYIKYCKEVSNIRWGSLSGLNGRRALVRTTDGSEYSADFVIYTASLGTLKSNHDSLFCPSLPCPKVKLIETMEYESVNKVFLSFHRPLCTWRPNPINWKFDADETYCLPDPLTGLREIKEICGSEKVIAITLVGRGAFKSEAMSEKNLVESIIDFIRKRTGECSPMPNDVIRTKWTGNKYFKGARPIQGCGFIAEALPSCGSPNPPVIHFAGDATSSINPGNVKGAFTSGIREADKILSYLPGAKHESQATDACLQLLASLSA